MNSKGTTSIASLPLCGDPSHTVHPPFGDFNGSYATQERVIRRLCLEPKVFKLRADGTRYTVHASSAAIRGGRGSEGGSSQGSEAYELALPSLDAAARTKPMHDNSVRLNTPQTADFPGPTLNAAVKKPFRGSRKLADSLPFGSSVSWSNPLYTPTNQLYTPAPFPSVSAGNSYGSIQTPMVMDPTAMLPPYQDPPALMHPTAMTTTLPPYQPPPALMPPTTANQMPKPMAPFGATLPQRVSSPNALLPGNRPEKTPTPPTAATLLEMALAATDPKKTTKPVTPTIKPVTTTSAPKSNVETRVKKVKDRGVRTRTTWKPSQAAGARQKAEAEWVDVGEEAEGKEGDEGDWTLL